MFETFPWLRILEFGLPGLAVILLYLSFHLLKSQRPDSSELASLQTDAQISAWKDAHRTTSLNIWAYFGLSAMFFLGGLFIAVYQPQNEIILSVAPPEGIMPKVRLQEEELPLDANGTSRLKVSNDYVVRVLNNHIFASLTELRSERDELQRQLRALEASRQADNSDSGI